MLCGKELPWVDKCDHLGHTLTAAGSMEQDCRSKRSHFIDEAVKIREQFKFAHPSELLRATDTYCTSFYGSNLWDLRGEAANMLYCSWRTNVKLVWNLPRSTRSYFIDTLRAPDCVPPSVSLMTRQLTFFHSLLESPSTEAQVLSRLAARDVRTNLGSKLSHIKQESGFNPWEFGGDRVRLALCRFHECKVPEQDIWRVNFLQKLLYQKLTNFYCNIDDTEEIDKLIVSLVTN